MFKLGLVVMSNNSGIGNQTRRLCQMLKPFRILAVDSSGFSRNSAQHWEWYDGFHGYMVHGFPTNNDVKTFLNGLTHVLCVENPFNFALISEARRRGIKSYVQSNYEFCDNLIGPEYPIPDMFLMPSWWKYEEMVKRFGAERVEYLPPPLDPNELKQARDINYVTSAMGKKQLLHIVGTLATHDRNGTLDLLKALKHTKKDFKLVIRSQHELPTEYITYDRRVTYEIADLPDQTLMYSGFDAMILPRRYGGLSLTMNEALMSGLPVIMPDIDPNNKLLPSEWLVPAKKIDEFQARVMIDVYGTDVKKLAKKIDWVLDQNCEKIKVDAFEIAYNTFSPSVLMPRYESIW